MNKKLITLSLVLLLSLTLFSGCLEKSSSSEKKSYSINNLPPVAKISAPDQAYFGDTIVFDASGSYDSDGQIVSYKWDFGDGENAEGIQVSHSYKFDNDFSINYPLIYSVTLLLEDSDEALIATTHEIKIYPRDYKFYLNSNELTIGEPASGKDKIKSLSYSLENPILVKKCKWNATIYLEKPLLATIKKLSVTFYDAGGNEVASKSEMLGSIIWKEKTVQLNGEFDNDVNFKSLKVEISSFSILNRVSIIYGGEKASYICFDFTN